MYEVGQLVKVNGEELDDIGRFVHGNMDGMLGQVILVNFNHGCGENNEGINGQNTDPMYHVGFDDGRVGSFFEEELFPCQE